MAQPNDMAVVTLENRSSAIKTFPLITNQALEVGSSVHIIGFGLYTEGACDETDDGDTSTVLIETDMIQGRSRCIDYNQEEYCLRPENRWDNQMCLDSPAGRTPPSGSCAGNSGSGAFVGYIIFRSLKCFVICWIRKGIFQSERNFVFIKITSVNNALS